MAQTALTITPIKQNNYSVQAGDLTVNMAASDAVNGNSFPATGREILLVQNSDAAAHTFTVTSVPDALGRTLDIATYSIAANTIVAIEMSQLQGWIQVNGNINLVSTSALLKYGILRYV
jgi:hypothetical protein